MAVIDADAHVIEWERTWEYMGEGERAFAPRVMVFKDQPQAVEKGPGARRERNRRGSAYLDSTLEQLRLERK